MRNSLRAIYIKRPYNTNPVPSRLQNLHGYDSASSHRRWREGWTWDKYRQRIKQVQDWKLGYGLSGHLSVTQQKRVRQLCAEYLRRFEKDGQDRIAELIAKLEK